MYLWIPMENQMFLKWIKMNLLCVQNTHIWSEELFIV